MFSKIIVVIQRMQAIFPFLLVVCAVLAVISILGLFVRLAAVCNRCAV